MAGRERAFSPGIIIEAIDVSISTRRKRRQTSGIKSAGRRPQVPTGHARGDA
jgi:hypothetical protein